jgi:predicted TIM-barrel fold metal-dependent hydrolase
MHVFGDRARYPLAAFRSYSVGRAEMEEYRAVQRRTGLERAVLVQASGYHTDNRCMLDALRSAAATCRGISMIDPEMPDAGLRELDAAGVRGVRVNLVSVGSFGSGVSRSLETLAARLAPLGWHIQLFATPEQLVEIADTVGRLPVPVVVDHMGLPRQAEGPNQPGFLALVRLVGEGRAWAKLSGADRITRGEPSLAGAAPFAKALIAANPDSLVWGSDWPHIGWHDSAVNHSDDILPFRQVEEGGLLRLLAGWVENVELLERILVANPARLYGFPAPGK